jgi:hypothetical protein
MNASDVLPSITASQEATHALVADVRQILNSTDRDWHRIKQPRQEINNKKWRESDLA